MTEGGWVPSSGSEFWRGEGPRALSESTELVGVLVFSSFLGSRLRVLRRGRARALAPNWWPLCPT